MNMKLLRLLVLFFSVSTVWGQSYWDHILHPERLSSPLDADVVHFSSWARNGSNSDLGHYYGVDQFGQQILCDQQGPGVIVAMWWTQDNQTPAWRWRLYVDNMTTALIDTPIVQPFGEMSPFLPPVADSSSGGYYSYAPIPFQDRVKITYNDAWDIYFHVTVLKFPAGTIVPSFTMPPSPEYMAMLDSLADRLTTPQTPIYVPTESSKDTSLTLSAGQSATVIDVPLTGQTRRLLLKLNNRTQQVFENFWVRVYTDGYPLPDIEGPISVTMGTPIGWRPYRSTVTGSVGDTLYFNLPIVADKRVRVEFENRASQPQPLYTKVELASSTPGTFRLHGQYHEMNPTRQWENYLIADFDGPGNYVGTVQDMQQRDNHVLEGDELFFIDGETTPSWHGTGTEDYYKGGRYWTPVYTQLPLHGCVAYLADTAAAYRWHNNDPIPFESHLRFETEVGRFNNLSGHYRTIAYAYIQRPQWKVVDASGDKASHTGEELRIVGKGIDPTLPIVGAQMGSSVLQLAESSFLTVDGDSLFDARFYVPDGIEAGSLPIMLMLNIGSDTLFDYDTLETAWKHLGRPTLTFQPTRTDIINAVYAGDTLAVELHGLEYGESASCAIDGIPCPWVGIYPTADATGRLQGKVRVPEGLYAGDFPVTATPQYSAGATADSLLHHRYWFRVEPEILVWSAFSGSRIKEEWCRDWIRFDNTDPWGRMACYVLTGTNATSYVTLPFWAPSGGTFSTKYFIGKTSNAAIVSVQINGENSLVNADMYQNTLYQSWVRSDTLIGGTHTLAQGFNSITLRTTGKNPSSSGWKAILDQIIFESTPLEPAPSMVEDVIIQVQDSLIRLTWMPVTEDVLGNPLVPYAYDIFRAGPIDSLWYWYAQVSGTDTTWTMPLSTGNDFDFVVSARRGTNIPLSVMKREERVELK